MPKHEIEASFPAHRVANTDLSVTVKSDGRKLGQLMISRGTVDWHPAKKQSVVTMRWETFASLMERWSNGEIS
jgi:hypothetical protein